MDLDPEGDIILVAETDILTEDPHRHKVTSAFGAGFAAKCLAG
jgi:hypothetical protein